MAESPTSSDGKGHYAGADDIETRKSSLDADALRLAELGYTQDMRRNFSVLSVLGVGFSLTNSWFGLVRVNQLSRRRNPITFRGYIY